jgi:hypothetical protein
MPEHNLNLEQCFRLIEAQITAASLERIEVLPILRARFGNLLREEIVSVMMEYQRSSYWIVISWLGEAPNRILLDPYLSSHVLELESPDLPSTYLWMDVIGDWLVALDDYRVVPEFHLLTDQALGLIERIGSCANLQQEDQAQAEEEKKAFYLNLASEMANEFAAGICKKVEAAVRTQYKSSPANGMVGDECSNEWQEMGAMLFDGTHLLLDMGIHQLQLAIASSIKTLTRAERLAIWCRYCEYIVDLDLEPSFDLLDDHDTFDEIVETLARNLQNDMVWDWENKLSEMEND